MDHAIHRQLATCGRNMDWKPAYMKPGVPRFAAHKIVNPFKLRWLSGETQASKFSLFRNQNLRKRGRNEKKKIWCRLLCQVARQAAPSSPNIRPWVKPGYMAVRATCFNAPNHQINSNWKHVQIIISKGLRWRNRRKSDSCVGQHLSVASESESYRLRLKTAMHQQSWVHSEVQATNFTWDRQAIRHAQNLGAEQLLTKGQWWSYLHTTTSHPKLSDPTAEIGYTRHCFWLFQWCLGHNLATSRWKTCENCFSMSQVHRFFFFHVSCFMVVCCNPFNTWGRVLATANCMPVSRAAKG